MALPIKRGGGGSSGGGGGSKRLAMTDVKTGAYTAVDGELVLVDHTGGSFPVTMPAAAPINAKVGVLCVGHVSGVRDEVTLDPSDYTFEGDHDNKLYLTDDLITFQSDGAGVWRTINESLTAHRALMELQTAQSLAISTHIKLLCNVMVYDNAALLDIGNSWGMVRRAGSYDVNVGVSTGNVGLNWYVINNIYKQATRWAQEAYSRIANQGGPYMSCQRDLQLAPGEIIENFVWQSGSAGLNTGSGLQIHWPYISIEENR